jgi:hypothetical protein
MFNVLPIKRTSTKVGHRGALDFRWVRDAFPYPLATGIPFKEGVPSPLQFKGRTPTPDVL